MRSIRSCCGCVLLLALAGAAPGCAEGGTVYRFDYGGARYEVVKARKSWAGAAAAAVARGGHLVEIGDQGEQGAVYDAIVHGAGVASDYASAADGGGVAYVWIGATDRDAEGAWVWDGDGDGVGTAFWTGQGAAGADDGAAVGGAFVDWGGTSTGHCNEPDDYGGAQDAAAIALDGWPSGSGSLGAAGEWNDIDASNELYFVVEIDAAPDAGDD